MKKFYGIIMCMCVLNAGAADTDLLILPDAEVNADALVVDLSQNDLTNSDVGTDVAFDDSAGGMSDQVEDTLQGLNEFLDDWLIRYITTCNNFINNDPFQMNKGSRRAADFFSRLAFFGNRAENYRIDREQERERDGQNRVIAFVEKMKKQGPEVIAMVKLALKNSDNNPIMKMFLAREVNEKISFEEGMGIWGTAKGVTLNNDINALREELKAKISDYIS